MFCFDVWHKSGCSKLGLSISKKPSAKDCPHSLWFHGALPNSCCMAGGCIYIGQMISHETQVSRQNGIWLTFFNIKLCVSYPTYTRWIHLHYLETIWIRGPMIYYNYQIASIWHQLSDSLHGLPLHASIHASKRLLKHLSPAGSLPDSKAGRVKCVGSALFLKSQSGHPDGGLE